MSRKATMYLTWEIAPFYRRWQGWRRVLWWAWPVRWKVVEEGRGYAVTDYFCTANDAAIFMCRRALRDPLRGAGRGRLLGAGLESSDFSRHR